MSGKKKFSFVSVILSVICVVFVCEAAAPAAAIGNQQFFWWIFLIITFLLPYGMVAAELGTAYDSEGGIYDWVRDALGDKWGARISWYYWINFPLWIASLATLFPPILSMVFGADIESNLLLTLGIEIAFVWIVVFMSFSKVSDSEWILNGGAVLKVLVAVSVGVLGIWYACANGFAGSMAPETFLPDLTNTAALGYLSIIIFNFTGFEVICTFAKDMQNPARDIPKAIILGGLAIGAIYLFCGFGIGAAIPADQIDPDFGMLYAVITMVGETSPIFIIIAVVFLITLFANMASWSFGVNAVAQYAAKNQNMPKVFAHENPKTGMPTGAAIVNGIVATAVLLIQLRRAVLDAVRHLRGVPTAHLHPHVPGLHQAAQGRCEPSPRVPLPLPGHSHEGYSGHPGHRAGAGRRGHARAVLGRGSGGQGADDRHLHHLPPFGRGGAHCERPRPQGGVQGPHSRDGRRAFG